MHMHGIDRRFRRMPGIDLSSHRHVPCIHRDSSRHLLGVDRRPIRRMPSLHTEKDTNNERQKPHVYIIAPTASGHEMAQFRNR